MIDKDILKTIPEDELREWLRARGYNLEAYDIVHPEWVIANTPATDTVPTTE